MLKTLSANEAVATISYNFIDIASVYPITPSTEMSETIYKMSSSGELNLFGNKVLVQEMQSECGSIGLLHGALTSGSLCSTYTCSQGLLLMIPELYRIRGAFLPGVVHVSSRSVATHALSIFCDHSDVYACRQTGWAMLCSSNVQEAHDFAAISHLVAIESSYPFIHFFDGFRTSHELQKIRIIDENYLKTVINYDKVQKFRNSSLSNYRPFIRGGNQNDDIYFQCCEAGNNFQNDIINHVENYMCKFNKQFATNYLPFNFYGDNNAECIIVAMGSVCNTIEEVVDFLNSKNKKVGLIKVHLFRPFSFKHFRNILPKTVKKISVLDRSKEPGSSGESLYLDVLSCIYDFRNDIKILSGRFGLGGKNTSPSDVLAVFENMFSENSKKNFTIGINDDISNLSIHSDKKIDNNSLITIKFFGKGSDGMVGASKNITKMIGETSDFFVQYYPQYDSKKSGGLTISHIRIGNSPIKSEYYINEADYVVCSDFEYMFKYDFTKSLKQGSCLILNCKDNKLTVPRKLKEFIDKNDIKVFTIDACKISSELNLGHYYGVIMQGAFLKICSDLNYSNKKDFIKKYIEDFYYKKNRNLIDANLKAIDLSFDRVTEEKIIRFTEDIEKNYSLQELVNLNRGNDLPVSKFLDHYNGNTPCGSSIKNEIKSDKYPKWIPENCSQCGMCSLVCPHASIRAFLSNDNEISKDIPYIKAFGNDKLNFTVSISKKHCTGCSLCTHICPGKMGKKALTMEPQTDKNNDIFDFMEKIPLKRDAFNKNTVHDVQFKEPLMRYSSACPGCGETGYARLISQLYGERLVISNATGCSSIWGGNASSTPYCQSQRGFSPAWQNSLFENAAEFGLGMYLAHKSIRNNILNSINKLVLETKNEDLRNICNEYIQTFDDGNKNFENSLKLIDELSKNDEKIVEIKNILNNREYVSKKSFWVFGGDGWAYDIGFAGLDHILSTHEDINIIVFDTEIYSNTGGQASKATPEHASASFALGGKTQKKKNLSKMMMSYEHVYVAQVSLGANISQCLKAITEAEKYHGPSLIVAYSPCIGHGIHGGLSNSIESQKLVVNSGLFPLFRYDPITKEMHNDSNTNLDMNLVEKFMQHERRFKN